MSGIMNPFRGPKHLRAALVLSFVIVGVVALVGPRAKATDGPDGPTVVTFGYDARGRLIDAAYHQVGETIRYEYDKAGNRTRHRVVRTIDRAPPALPAYPGQP